MAKIEQKQQSAECVEIREWNTVDYKNNPVVKKIGVFRLEGSQEPFEVFESKAFIPEKGAFYTPFLYVKQVPTPWTNKDTGELKAYNKSVVSIRWEKV
jgi:hypothetical protein